MNLVDRVMNEIDGIGVEELDNRASVDLLPDLIKRALSLRRENANVGARLSSILCGLSDADNLRGLLRNPELFPPIQSLSTDSHTSLWESQLDLLEFHLNQRPLENLSLPPSSFLRTRGQVYTNRSGSWELVENPPMSHKLGEWTVYLPFDGLFNDLFDTGLYPSRTGMCDTSHLVPLIEHSRVKLARFSARMLADMDLAVHTIGLTWDNGFPSSSSRLGFNGGILVNPYWNNGQAVAASIIHEYCHQRLWQWWHFAPLVSSHQQDLQIRSPVSGNNRSLLALLQALLIYVECLDFYQREILDGAVDAWPAQRAEHLRKTLPDLFSSVENAVHDNPRISAYLRIVRDEYREICTETNPGPHALIP
jgi:hypothetical protein